MNLVSMYGKPGLGAPQYQFSLFSMSGRNDLQNDPIVNINPNDLSDVDAGIQALYIVAAMHPGITWGDFLSRNSLGRKWYERWIGDPAKSLVSWTGDTISNVGDKLGDWGGSTVRLITDERVSSGLSNYGAAYLTGGGSEAAKSLFGGKADLGSVLEFLGGLGKKSKQSVEAAGLDMNTLIIFGGGLLLVVLLLRR